MDEHSLFFFYKKMFIHKRNKKFRNKIRNRIQIKITTNNKLNSKFNRKSNQFKTFVLTVVYLNFKFSYFKLIELMIISLKIDYYNKGNCLMIFNVINLMMDFLSSSFGCIIFLIDNFLVENFLVYNFLVENLDFQTLFLSKFISC